MSCHIYPVFTYHRYIGAFCQDLAIDQYRKVTSTETIQGVFPGLRSRDGRDGPRIDSCVSKSLRDVGDMIQVDAEDQGGSPIPGSMEIRSNNELVDRGRIDERSE